MQDSIQRQILGALLLVLRPLARALLKAGVGYREFAEISKTAFVEIATRDYGLRGRPTNISRVAVMTGLTRKEVRRLRDKTESGQETLVVRSTPMSIILHRWYTDEEFLTSKGEPRQLPFEGQSSSFTSPWSNAHGAKTDPGYRGAGGWRSASIEAKRFRLRCARTAHNRIGESLTSSSRNYRAQYQL